jgi:hypothetical protein
MTGPDALDWGYAAVPLVILLFVFWRAVDSAERQRGEMLKRLEEIARALERLAEEKATR